MRHIQVTSKQVLNALNDASELRGSEHLERAHQLLKGAALRNLDKELAAKSLSMAIEPYRLMGLEHEGALVTLSHELLRRQDSSSALSAVALIAFYSGTPLYQHRSEVALKELSSLPSPIPEYLLPKIEGYMKVLAESQKGLEFTAYDCLRLDIQGAFPMRSQQTAGAPHQANPLLDKIVSFGEHLGALCFSDSTDEAGLKVRIGLLNAEALVKEYPWLYEVAVRTLTHDRGDETTPLRATVARQMMKTWSRNGA